jgi:hypothetical protein
MDGLGGFLSGVFVGVLIAVISIAWSMTTDETITMAPIKDDYKNEILYYIDTNTKKTYKMENDILYYYEED